MNITINGEQKTVPDSATVAEILELFKIVAATIVVEHNGAIIQPDSYAGSSLAEGDRLEFIRFVGGG
jgi:sulfur carrier protein